VTDEGQGGGEDEHFAYGEAAEAEADDKPREPQAWESAPQELADHCERWTRNSPRLRMESLPPMPIYMRDTKVHVDPDQWGTGKLSEIAAGAPLYESSRPEEGQETMKAKSPQALLRDLFRPIHDFSQIEPAYIETGYQPANMAAATLEIGLVGRTRLASKLDPACFMSRALVEEQARRRAWLLETWHYEKPPDPDEKPETVEGFLMPKF